MDIHRVELVVCLIWPYPSLPSPKKSYSSYIRIDKIMFGKKSKKPLKHIREIASLGIPTNIAIGPLGFQTDLNVDPESEQDLDITIPGRTDLIWLQQ